MKSNTQNQIMRSKTLAAVIGTYRQAKYNPSWEDWCKELARHFGNRQMSWVLNQEGVTKKVKDGNGHSHVEFIAKGGNVHYNRIAIAARKACDYQNQKNKETRHKYAELDKMAKELAKHGYKVEKPSRRSLFNKS